MGITSGMMSSASAEWETPQDLFDRVAAEFGGFNVDVCATKRNAKCRRYYSRRDDGLSREWTGKCWMNPPYGREIGKWMKKALESARAGALVVCLVPARTDTAWWHDYAAKGEVRFFRGRLRFRRPGGGGLAGAPFPSALIVFRPGL